MRHILLPALLLAACLAAPPAPGQVGPAVAGQTIDDSALRYYARTGDLERLEAELRRLRAWYPDWVPPADLMDPAPAAGTGDEGPVWQLHAAGDFAGARAMIAGMRRAHPGYAPSAELLAALDIGEARQRIADAAASGDWPAVRLAAEASPALLACGTVDMAWHAAEAFARTGAEDRASALYLSLVEGCDDAHVRLATIQKASLLLPESDVDALLAAEQPRPRAAGEERALAEFHADRERGRILKAIADGRPVSDEAWRSLADAAQAKRDAGLAGVLGWSYYRQEDWPMAAQWFEQALAWQPDAKAAEGLILSDLALGRTDDAQRLFEAWAGRSEAIDKLARDHAPAAGGDEAAPAAQALQAGRFGECLARTAPPLADAGTAAIRGWCLYNLDRPHEARIQFADALDRSAPDSAARRDAAYGLALAEIRIGHPAAARDLGARHAFDAGQRATLKSELIAGEAEAAFAAGDHAEVIRLLDHRREFAPEPRYLQVLAAWSFYHLGRVRDSHDRFETMHRLLASADTAEELRVTKAALGRGKRD